MRAWLTALVLLVLLVLDMAGPAAAQLARMPPHQQPAGDQTGLACGGASAPLLVSSPEGGEMLFLTSFNARFDGGNLIALPAPANPAGSTPLWQARETMEAASVAGQRVVLSLRDDGSATPFVWDQLDASARKALSRDAARGVEDDRGPERLDYLRGSHASELALGFRARPGGVLGAIVNSSPWWMAAPSAGYATLQAPGYPEFRASSLSRPAMLWVGTEDGMLHGLRASDGAPLVSYAARALLPALASLSAPPASAAALRPWLDGSPMVADVNLDDTLRGWRSLLFAPMGRGARGVLAMDVTQAQFSEAAAASVVRWEFTDSDDADLGYLISRPQIDPLTRQPRQVVRLANGRWALLLGNGYDSAAGNAVLLVVYVNGPTGVGGRWQAGLDYLKIPTGPAGSGPRNGLGVPMPLDLDGDGRIDVVYAADLKGNVWKFDLSAPRASDWQPAFGSAPFYVAKPASGTGVLAITAGLLARPHPLGGTMLQFGTGRALEERDLPVTQMQSLFGIWDRPDASAPPAGGRNRLLQQTTQTDPNGRYVFSSALHVSDWSRTDGWVLDLPLVSESLLSHPEALGDAISFKTDFKSGRPASGCDTGWDGNLWLLGAIDGARIERGFDLNGDGRFTQADLLSAADGSVRSPSALVIRGGSGESSRVLAGRLIRTGEGVQGIRLSGGKRAGRLQWRELGD